MACVMMAPSEAMRLASHGGTLPVWRGRSALPVRRAMPPSGAVRGSKSRAQPKRRTGKLGTCPARAPLSRRHGQRKGKDMEITNFKDMYIAELQELVSVEQQLGEALLQMASVASHPSLKAAFTQHH